MDTLLEGAYAPPPGIVPNQAFTRRQDDTDGETGFEHQLSVGVTVDGDAWVLLPDRSLRFRVPFGGGASPRVQRALVVLAEAIRRDNQDNPPGALTPIPMGILAPGMGYLPIGIGSGPKCGFLHIRAKLSA